MNPFLQKLQEGPLLCDGGMGTMLYAKGASSEQCLEQLVVSRPGWVTTIHQAYASAGADVIKSQMERHKGLTAEKAAEMAEAFGF